MPARMRYVADVKKVKEAMMMALKHQRNKAIVNCDERYRRDRMPKKITKKAMHKEQMKRLMVVKQMQEEFHELMEDAP